VEVSGQVHAPAALPHGKSPRYPFYRRLGGLQSWSRRDSEERNPCLFRVLKSSCPDRSLVTIHTELQWQSRETGVSKTCSGTIFGRDWATGWTIGILRFDFRRRLGIFIFTIASRTSLGPTQLHNQWVPGALSLGVKRPGREVGPPSSAEVKEWVELYFHSPIRLHGVVLS
jgi:hypothetical protein